MELTRINCAKEILADTSFLDDWIRLYKECIWATIFQAPEYITIWFENYEAQFELLLVTETDEDKRLTGLLPLALERSTGRLLFAGDHHCEYKSWLSTMETKNSFPDSAFRLVKAHFPKSKLEMTFLAPNSPLDWLENGWRGHYHVHSVPRSLISLNDENTSEESLRKRGNRSRLRQLSRKGKVELREITSSEEFAKLFDKAEQYSRLRLSGLHNVQSEADPQRKAFYCDLFERTNILSVTTFRVGEEDAAIKICMRNREDILLSVTAMSPFLAKQSPSKLHLLMLGSILKQSGAKFLDLSPGDGYKERFSDEQLSVDSLQLFFDKFEGISFNARRKLISSGLHLLSRFGIDRNKIEKTISRLASVRRHPEKTHAIFRRLSKWGYAHKECRIYAIETKHILDAPAVMKVDSLTDLLKYKKIESLQDSRSDFHKRAISNFENGVHSYSISLGEKLLHYGWLVPRQSRSELWDVDQGFDLPPNSAVLFDYYTDPEARGKGLYRKSLLQGLSDAKLIPDTKYVYIAVLADNISSRSVIEAVGFQYKGSLITTTIFGRKKKSQVWGRIDSTNVAQQDFSTAIA